MGLLGAKCEAPEGHQEAPEGEQEKAGSRKKPLEERKNFCWIEGLRDSNALAAELPSTRQVCVNRAINGLSCWCAPNMTVVRMASTSSLRP